MLNGVSIFSECDSRIIIIIIIIIIITITIIIIITEGCHMEQSPCTALKHEARVESLST